MNEAINAIYRYVNDADDPDECKVRLDNMLDFVIRLRHSFVDNDKPKPTSNYDINMEIFRRAELNELKIGFVELKDEK